jgi:hypothetical protein
MNDLYEIWLKGVEAEYAMCRIAGYDIGWKHLANGEIDLAEKFFKTADDYCATMGWRLPVQIQWQAEIKRIRMLKKINTKKSAAS